tara:strand:- start:4557 stop:4793 length:237 start_codon:yes stop_codon:yes gene_type:complete
MIDTKTTYVEDEMPTLEKLQELVGGYIEIVLSADMRKQIVVDEEGLLKGKEFNEEASRIAGQKLFGNAVVLSDDALLD